MKVASKVKDGRINAVNILLDMNIREYLEVAGNIIKNNEFQRKRVKNSSTVYALLKKDLRSNCTMPPIVLAIKAEKMNHLLNPYDVDEEQIKSLFKPENLIILDGLQRTYTILDLVDELKKENNIEVLNNVLDNSIRIEVYLGINKIGILYRMLTLNTGQTPMSIRHQIEMLYSDYLDYWMKEYFEINYKYSTAKRYKESLDKIKEELGYYKLSKLTPFILNKALLKLYQTSITKEALRNYQKVIKSSLRDATYYFGFIKNNPAGDLQIPRVLSFELKK